MASISSILTPTNLIHSSKKPTDIPQTLSSQFLRPISFHPPHILLRISPVAAKPPTRLFAVAEVATQGASSVAERKLYIGNIPRNVNNEELTRIVQEHGAVEKAEVSNFCLDLLFFILFFHFPLLGILKFVLYHASYC